MTISTTTSRIAYLGTGSVFEYAYPFKIVAAEHLLVLTRSAVGVVSVLTLSVDYTLTGVGNASGGTVELTDALALGAALVLLRVPEIVQSTDIRNQAASLPTAVEAALDYRTQVEQYLADSAARAARLSAAEDPGDYSLTLPTASGAALIGWDETGRAFRTYTTADLLAGLPTLYPVRTGEVGVTNLFFKYCNAARYGYADMADGYDATEAAACLTAVRNALASYYALNSAETPPAGFEVVIPGGTAYLDGPIPLGPTVPPTSSIAQFRALQLRHEGARWLFTAQLAGRTCVDGCDIHGGSDVRLPAIGTDTATVLASDSSTWPKIGLLRARAKNGANTLGSAQNSWHKLTIYGYYTLANYYNYAGEVDNYWDSRIDNLATTEGAYCWYVTNSNEEEAVTSEFFTLPTGQQSMQGHYIYRIRLSHAVDALGLYPGDRAAQRNVGAYFRFRGVNRLVLEDPVLESGRENVTYPCVWLDKEASATQGCSDLHFLRFRASDALEYREAFRLGGNVSGLRVDDPTMAFGARAFIVLDTGTVLTGIDMTQLRTTGGTWAIDASAANTTVRDARILANLPSRFGYRFYGAIQTTIAATPVTVTLTAAAAADENNDTVLSVAALSGDIPSNVTLDFGGGKEARTRLAATAGATSLTVRAIPVALSIGDAATYRKGVVFDDPTQVSGPGVAYAELDANVAVSDADYTAAVGVTPPTIRYTAALTANRTVTLNTSYLTCYKGARFRVVRTGLGAFTLDVGGLKTIPAATAAWVEVEHTGSAWALVGYGTL